MLIGILQCGRVPESLRPQHGDYDTMFESLLDGFGFRFQTWPVLDNVFPSSIQAADGWLITGSKHGVYENHVWIPPLEAFLQSAYTANIPVVGICFGHQILAQALGGTVVKFDGGWSLGPVSYKRRQGSDVMVHAVHQDQVIRLPDEAACYGSTPFCEYAFLRYRKRAISMQPHPEINDAYLRDLIDVRRSSFPDQRADAALAAIGAALATDTLAEEIAHFFQNHARTAAADINTTIRIDK